MSDLIARKYAKAIMPRADVGEFYSNLCVLNSAFILPKFQTLIKSTQIRKEKKVELLISLFAQVSPSFENFLRLLAQNSRLSCIPQIVKELEKERSSRENVYPGIVYTKENLSGEGLRDLENRLCTKLGVKIQLQNHLSQDDDVRITLEELGYEISFSMKTLQSKMSEFILKNI